MDVHALLAAEQPVECTLLHQVGSASWTDHSGKPSEMLAKETKVDLPLWLARSLHQEKMLEVALPTFYSSKYRMALKADATHLDLHSQSDYYFENGALLSQMLESEQELGRPLIKGFATRFHMLIAAAQSDATGKSQSMITPRLSYKERELFELGRAVAFNHQQWQVKRPTIARSKLIATERGGKRRRGTSAS